VNDSEEVGSVLYINAFFTVEECASLSDHLVTNDNLWEYREDTKQGPKAYLIAGVWTAQGQTSYGKGQTYAAGLAGKWVAEDPDRQSFYDPMASWGVRLCGLLQSFRPDAFSLLQQVPISEKPIGGFPLFMAAQGIAKMHCDNIDYVSILVLIRTTSTDCGGGLEISGSKTCINWVVGDVIIIDSAKLMHGTQAYTGDPDDRIVAMWLGICTETFSTRWQTTHTVTLACRLTTSKSKHKLLRRSITS